MAYDEQLGERVARMLTALGIRYTEKKMFGGLGFMINDKMCVGIVKSDLMLRVIEDKFEEVLEMPETRPMDFAGRPMRGFVYVDPGGFGDDRSLKRWIDLAIEFGEKGVVKSKRKTKPPRKR